MDISFHYFAVKTLAIEAGFDATSAQTIATFSQYIDDYNAYLPRSYTNIPETLKQDSKYDVFISDSPLNFNPPTTGFVDTMDLATLLLPRSQKFTVLPFHFIPRTLSDLQARRLVTEEASIGDGSLISGCLTAACTQYKTATAATRKHALMRIGMLLHTFADTCAHQKFSGILADQNIVTVYTVHNNITGTDQTVRYQSYIDRYISRMTNQLKKVFLRIGHGMAGHIPDFTHVTWYMRRQDGTLYHRDNTEAFTLMCRKILNYLRSCRNLPPVGDAQWEELEEKLRRAFLVDISEDSEAAAYTKLCQHWSSVFDCYVYRYDAKQVFSQALDYNVSPIAIPDPDFYTFVQYVQDFLITLYGNRPRDDTSVVNEVCEFNCGSPEENSYAVCPSGLPVASRVQINGNEDLSEIVKFNDSGCVYSIRLVKNPTSGSIYSYEIQVDARGPSGAGSGSGYLYFTDATGDSYALSIYRSGRHLHVVDYNSRDPRITTITWSNHKR